MCRSIKTLRRPEGHASDEEIAAAALQYIRKVSGYRAPSQRNSRALDAAVREGGRASRHALDESEKARTEPAPRASRARASSKCPRRRSTSAPTYCTFPTPAAAGSALREGE